MKIKWKYVAVLLVVIYIFMNYFPIKIAVKEIPSDAKDHIVVERVKTTGFNWSYPDSDGGEYYVVLSGNHPPMYDFNQRLWNPENKYLCFGHFEDDVYVSDQMAKKFHVDRWEYMYPVLRDSLLSSAILPKYGVTIIDYIFS